MDLIIDTTVFFKIFNVLFLVSIVVTRVASVAFMLLYRLIAKRGVSHIRMSRMKGCGVRGYLLHPLLHTPHSLTLYSALLKIVLPCQNKDNIFKIPCQHLKSKFFAVFLRLVNCQQFPIFTKYRY